MTSIRRRLLFSIWSLLTLAAVAVGIATYFSIRHEMDELYDANMRQLALVASGMMADRGEPVDAATLSKKWPKGEQIFLVQIWDGDSLIYSSHPIATFPLQPEPGFGRTFFNDKRWSYYQERINGKTVQVSQALHERRDVIREVYHAVIIPTLVQFPIVFLVVWLLINAGLRPLSRISDLIQKRKAGFLEPISPGEAPSEIHTLVLALNDLLARLGASMETQRRFTADAAHELRTPLTAVRLQLDLLARAGTNTDRAEAMSSLESGVNRSIRLVQQLLELARQEPDAGAPPFEQLDLSHITESVAREQRPMAEAKSIDLITDLQSASVRGDEAALAVMIGNLLNNAIAYTPAGGQITLRLSTADGRPALTVSDTGAGIAPENRDRIFDRFFRVVGSGVSGSGLGLSIVKTIADRHGASIDVACGPDGRGTTFRAVFPPA